MGEQEDLDEDLFADLYDDPQPKVELEQSNCPPTSTSARIADSTTVEPPHSFNPQAPEIKQETYPEQPNQHMADSNGQQMQLDQGFHVNGNTDVTSGMDQGRFRPEDDQRMEEKKPVYGQQQHNDPNAFYNKEDG